MRVKSSFLCKKLKFFGLVLALCLGGALLAYGGFKIFAAVLSDDARVNEDDMLTYYITVNSDGIDHKGIESSDSQLAQETSDITTVTDRIPDGLIFQGFVTSPDGTFGSVERDDKTSSCAGVVIDDTNEESITEGAWNDDETEYTYHGLHYNANTRMVSFRTKGITAGCELTVGVITKTPILPEGVFRMDFYDHASFVDESLFGDSNTVHAYIQKDTLPGEYWVNYRYDGVVPDNAPALPPSTYYDSAGAAITIANVPSLEGYTFAGWFWDNNASSKRLPAASLTSLPGKSIEVYGEWTRDESVPLPDDAPTRHDVIYEIDGEKPEVFNVPASRSYYEGSSVELDPTKSGENFDGYDFSGWETDDVELSNDPTFTMPSKNVLLRGSFEREQYTVEYAFVGDEKPENAESLLPASAQYYAGDVVEVAGVVSADGYTFSGWYADSSFEMPANNVTIQGEWTKNKTEFAPEISINILNPKDEFVKGDVVEFAVTITNNQNFALNNVWLEELLPGATFTIDDGYTVDHDIFANIATIPANSSVIVYASYVVEKNLATTYTNTVEIITLEAGNSDYVLPNNWNNKASVDFATGVIPDMPVDKDDNAKTPKTYDGAGKFVASGATIAGGIALCVFLSRRFRRSGALFGYCALIMGASGLGVAIINNHHIFADSNTERPELSIYSTKLNYANKDAGSWEVKESGSWTGVGEATLKIQAKSNKISDLHNKDVILILDNSVWTKSALDGTVPDAEDDLPAMDLMKMGASDFITDLLSDGDSRVIVYSTWGNINSSLTSDEAEALAQVNEIVSSDNTNYNSYSASYDKVLNFLDTYEQSDDRALNIVYISDDHIANSADIVKYKMVKAKAPSAVISGVGFGVKELIKTRYTSAASASESGVVRYWYGVDGNLRPIGSYTDGVKGLEYITDYYEDPYYKEYVAALVRCVDGSLLYSKFNIETAINTDDFEIKGIFSNVGDIEVDGNKISWINEEKGLVSGANYEMSVLLKAKDSSVEKHKLYRLNNNTTVETDAADIEADSASSADGVVLMNGYELKFSVNNNGTCSLGNNATGVYLAHQKIALDEEGVSCEGWNFDTFKSVEDGLIYSTRNDTMPAADLDLMATWRKVDVEVHMDGQIYSSASAVLADGLSFNTVMKNLTNPRYTQILKKADGCPRIYQDDAHRLSDDDSDVAIYGWFTTGAPVIDINPDTGEYGYQYSSAVYYCSDSDKIVMNEDSRGMFSDDGYYDEDDNWHDFWTIIRTVDESVGDWDASNVKNMDYMFADSELGVKAYEIMANWDVSNVESMDHIFDGTGRYNRLSTYSEDALKGWNTENVKSMKYAFSNTGGVIENLGGIAGWNTSDVEDMNHLLYETKLNDVNALKKWNVLSVKDLGYAFYNVKAPSSNNTPDLSGISDWKTPNLESLNSTFGSTTITNLNILKDWNVSNVKYFEGTFGGSKFSTNGVSGDTSALSGWKMGSATSLACMFCSSNVSSVSSLDEWDVSKVTNFGDLFSNADDLTSLAGLDGWVPSSATNMRYIFSNAVNLTDISALSEWSDDVSNVTNLERSFRGTNVDNLNALKDWDVSNVTNLAYAFCGAPEYISALDQTFECDSTTSAKNRYQRSNYGGPKSLTGLEGWKNKTGNVVNMEGMLAGGVITDLTPISEWDVTGVENMSKTFMRLNVANFSSLRGWETTSLKNLSSTFGFSRATTLTGLEEWDVSKVENLDLTFRDMYNLTSLEALSDWEFTDKLKYMAGTFSMHHNLTSLHGLEDWNIASVDSFYRTFEGYSIYDPDNYTDWSKYCDTKLTDISAIGNWEFGYIYSMERFFACDEDITSLSSLSNWRLKIGTTISSFNRFLEGAKSLQNLNGVQHWFDETAEAVSAEHKGYPQFNYAFMNMTSLNDISALASWNNANISTVGIRMFMMNDRQITDLSPLEDTFFKSCPHTGAWCNNAFDNTSATAPSWY